MGYDRSFGKELALMISAIAWIRHSLMIVIINMLMSYYAWKLHTI